jgi:hypothetical protein
MVELTEGGGAGGTEGGSTTPPWFDAYEPEIKTHIQAKGWDKLDPVAAFKAQAASYKEAERLLGAPREQLIRLPSDPNDSEGWNAINAKLGVPADKTAYNFKELKFADGKPLDDNFIEQISTAVHAARLRPDQATQVVAAFMKTQDEAAKLTNDNGALLKQQNDAALTTAWGQNRDLNETIAKRAANQLGITDEDLSALTTIKGGPATWEMLLKLGKAMGEARFITNENTGGGNGVLSLEQALARKTELYADNDFVAKYTRGDVAALKEMNDLDYLIVRARYNQR